MGRLPVSWEERCCAGSAASKKKGKCKSVDMGV